MKVQPTTLTRGRFLDHAKALVRRALDARNVERMGRDLFDRGYRLGLMQARAGRQARDASGQSAARAFDPLVEPGRDRAGPSRRISAPTTASGRAARTWSAR